MEGGPKIFKAAKAKFVRRKFLVQKADKEVLVLKKALEAGKCKARVAQENCEEAEFELEVLKRKTNMEEIFWRLSYLGRQNLEELDNQSLVKCYKVNKWWQKFMDGQKTVYIRKTQSL